MSWLEESAKFAAKQKEKEAQRQPSPEDYSCKGCKHSGPGNCAISEIGEDGYYHLPEGDCWEGE